MRLAAAQLTGHTVAVWSKHYARSFGRDQRREARDRMLAHGFGAIETDSACTALAPNDAEPIVEGPLNRKAPR